MLLMLKTAIIFFLFLCSFFSVLEPSEPLSAPPGLTDYLKAFLIQITGFIVLVWLLWKLSGKLFTNYLENRQKKILQTYEDLRQKINEVSNQINKIQEELKDIDAIKKERISIGLLKAEKIKNDLEAETKTMVENIYQKIRAEIEIEKEKAKAEIHNLILQNSIKICSDELEKEFSVEKQNNLMHRLLEKLKNLPSIPITFIGVKALTKRYAISILKLCQNKLETIKTVEEELSIIAKIFDENKKFKELLLNPEISFQEKKKVISDILKNRVSKLTFDSLLLIVSKGRTSILPELAEQFARLSNIAQNIERISLETLHPIPGDIKEKLLEILQQKLPDKKIILEEKINKKLLGGVKLKIRDLVIDDTLISKLKFIRSELSY